LRFAVDAFLSAPFSCWFFAKPKRRQLRFDAFSSAWFSFVLIEAAREAAGSVLPRKRLR